LMNVFTLRPSASAGKQHVAWFFGDSLQWHSG
jgi:hypothetical protein